jgi:hypothetical protein
MAEPNRVEIQEVVTDLVITENIGSLTGEETEKLIRTVVERLKMRESAVAQREKDTEITNRVYPPHVR